MATVGWYNVRDYASPHAALSALLTAGGGVLYFPAGTYAINSTLSVDGGGAGIGGNKPVIIQGDGASVSGHGTNQGTIINWTGTGGVVIDVSNLARMVSVRDLQIDNTGTGAAAIRVNQTDSFSSENVVIYPTTGFSAAAVQIGNSANVVSVTLKNVYLRGNYVALELDSVAAHLVGVNVRCLESTNRELVIGTPSTDCQSIHFFGSTFEGGANRTCVVVHRGENVTFHGCHFEHDGSGYAIDIPSSALRAWAMLVDGSWFSGARFGNATTYAINVNFPSAYVTVRDSYFAQYANPGYAIRNQSSARVMLAWNDINFSGAQQTTSWTNMAAEGNSLAGVVQPRVYPW